MGQAERVHDEYEPKISALENRNKELETRIRDLEIRLSHEARLAEMERALDAWAAAREESKRGPTGRQGERGARGEQGMRGPRGFR